MRQHSQTCVLLASLHGNVKETEAVRAEEEVADEDEDKDQERPALKWKTGKRGNIVSKRLHRLHIGSLCRTRDPNRKGPTKRLQRMLCVARFNLCFSSACLFHVAVGLCLSGGWIG